MKIDFPIPAQYKHLMQLWQDAFGDDEDFVEGFFFTGFSPSRCRCVLSGQQVAAALYWFDVRHEGRRYAYIYAVAVAEHYRNQGLCRKLMEDTHAHLALRGYDGALLVPQTDTLRDMYTRMGYQNCTTVSEFVSYPSCESVDVQRIDRDTYARRRREMLPAGGVLQEDENIAFLETMTFFYQGEDFLMAANIENGMLRCPELLGNASQAPAILRKYECDAGRFRVPGDEKPFAMFLPLKKDAKAPGYFGLAFD